MILTKNKDLKAKISAKRRNYKSLVLISLNCKIHDYQLKIINLRIYCKTVMQQSITIRTL